MDFPEVKLPFLDRILVTCEMYDIPAVIVVNKTDLYDGALTARLEDFRRIYEGAGYPVMAVSAKTGEGVDGLRKMCDGSLSMKGKILSLIMSASGFENASKMMASTSAAASTSAKYGCILQFPLHPRLKIWMPVLRMNCIGQLIPGAAIWPI